MFVVLLRALMTSHLLHLSPPRGERSDSKRSEGIRVRGRLRESEPVETPPHPTCFAPLALRLQVDPGSSPGQALSPHAGRGGASGARGATRIRGRLRESEPAETPPHPTYFAPQALRSQVDPGSSPGQALSPHAGRGGASGTRGARRRARPTPRRRG